MVAENESGTVLEYAPFIVGIKSLLDIFFPIERMCAFVAVILRYRDAQPSCLLRQTTACIYCGQNSLPFEATNNLLRKFRKGEGRFLKDMVR